VTALPATAPAPPPRASEAPLPPGVSGFLLADARRRFLDYVTIDTSADPDSGRHPSSPGQLTLARRLQTELEELRLAAVEVDPQGYVYATLPASAGVAAPALTFCAHLDTSPSVSGAGVRPVCHAAYDGGPISFPDDPHLRLTPEDSPELRHFIGQTIITASGRTLLGADDKAGIAGVMAALAAIRRFDGLRHPELRIVFTPDEEIGQGTDHIRLERLGGVGYTMDGGLMGELEAECFDAGEVTLVFHGHNIHPGYAKDRMVNAVAIAARFVAALPEAQTPEHTAGREGFIHVTDLRGNESTATLKMILRDFEAAGNAARLELILRLQAVFEQRWGGLRIERQHRPQYRNMREVLERHPLATQQAAEAIRRAGIEPRLKAIRGGTDGARLSFMGMPTPNIFAGGLLFHSRKEWIPEIALGKSAEVILHLCHLWGETEAVAAAP
jgi:tripeptide aminopeptidase